MLQYLLIILIALAFAFYIKAVIRRLHLIRRKDCDIECSYTPLIPSRDALEVYVLNSCQNPIQISWSLPKVASQSVTYRSAFSMPEQNCYG